MEFRDEWLDQIGARQVFSWQYMPSEGRSGGMLVGVRDADLELIKVEAGMYCLQAELKQKVDGAVWNFVCVYGDAQSSGKEAFLRKLAQVCSNSKHPTCFAGDFNLIRRADEKTPETPCTK